MCIQTGDGQTLKQVIYESEEGIYNYSVSDTLDVKKEKSQYTSIESYIQYSENLVFIDFMDPKISVLSAEYADNGNVVMNIASNNSLRCLLLVEISPEGNIISIKMDEIANTGDDRYEWTYVSDTITLEYGVANDLEFQTLLAAAKSAAVSEEAE